MSRSIWKFAVPITDHFSMPMPTGARVLTAQMQRDNLVLWAEIDEHLGREEARHFYVVGTGTGRVPPDARYISTVQDGQFVWHIYEDTKGTA